MTDTPFTWPTGIRCAVSITLDDARPSQLDRAIPLLDARGVRATFYVSLNNVERRAAEWRQVAARGHEIGNHTLTHPCSGNFAWSRHNALEDYTLARMEEEMDGADARILALLGVRPRTFAYPCGQTFVGRGAEARSYVPLVATRYLAGRGFQAEAPNDPAFCDLAQAGAMDADNRPFEQYRAWLERAAETGGWLILAGHEVGEAAFQTVRADALAALCDYVRDPANGVWCDTVEAVASHVATQRGMGDEGVTR